MLTSKLYSFMPFTAYSAYGVCAVSLFWCHRCVNYIWLRVKSVMPMMVVEWCWSNFNHFTMMDQYLNIYYVFQCNDFKCIQAKNQIFETRALELAQSWKTGLRLNFCPLVIISSPCLKAVLLLRFGRRICMNRPHCECPTKTTVYFVWKSFVDFLLLFRK